MKQKSNEIDAVFASYPHAVRQCLDAVRALIIEVAMERDVGPLTETLKWGEPAYLTEATKAEPAYAEPETADA